MGKRPAPRGRARSSRESAWARDFGADLKVLKREEQPAAQVLFETGRGNGWLVHAFRDAVHEPLGTSLAASLYRLLANDTDFSEFKKMQLAGLNFAFAENWQEYHSALDQIDRLDARSLREHGVCALSLARDLGNRDLKHITGGDVIYFNLARSWMIIYPAAAALPLALLPIVALGWLIWRGRNSGKLTIKGMIAGLLVAVSGMIAAVVVALVIQRIAIFLAGPLTGYLANLYVVAMVAATILVFCIVSRWAGRRVEFRNLFMGALLLWTLATVFTAALLPGASFVFMWPVTASLVSAWVLLQPERPDAGSSPSGAAIMALMGGCVVLIAAPACYLCIVALGWPTVFLVSAVVVMMLTLIWPLVRDIQAVAPRASAALLVLVIAGSLVALKAKASYSPNSPKESIML